MVLKTSHRIRDVRPHRSDSALSGLRFSSSIAIWGRYDHIMFPFREQSHNRIYKATNFSPSGRYAYPGDSANTSLGVILVKATSFRVSTTSPIDSRIFFIAGYIAPSAVVGSLSLLRKPPLCIWSFMPAKTIVY